ncbi:hypothetical protein M409DRAFT_29629 [Zasmidium cellare ATCC 36951]|uniref:CRIB domain-containing protein n=1 Tax=Zasmidium cellare ATCC 36951 TaxID=1080233 RepID=A0A6A6BYD6_ZASCE|nr:uncharacterized protein M409DRAFT_29629 [Zasmidium cellare ATCC 36951]KAF2159817.1 hypothetical protein M409DRAFT_29629 [Zasmidium cellare ATCC 36951]
MGTSQSNAGVDPLNPPPHLQRPGTAQSESKRRTTDPLESIRNSLFGGRKHAAVDGLNPPRPSSRQSQKSKKSRKSQSVDHSLLPFTQQGASFKTPAKEGQFNSAKEYYRHHKKSSISPPFNFQHITHTARKHLPRLETVDEKDLSARFWALNAYQKPKQHLTGIKAEDLGKRRERSVSPGGRPVSSRRTTEASGPSPTAASHTLTCSVDETVFDETQETKFNPDDAYRSLEDVHNAPPTHPPPRRPSPKHYSSMSALSSPPASSDHRHVRAQGSFDETRLSRSPPRPGPQRARTSLPVQSMGDKKLLGQSFHEKQPLPSIPQEESSRKDSKISLGSGSSRAYSLFPAPPGQKIEYPSSVKSKRPSMSAATVATLSSQKTDVLNESTWEDDIDFAYEQEAEAMCDFDWENASCSPLPEENEPDSAAPSGHPSPVESSGASSPSGGVRLSTSTFQPSAFTSDSSIANRARSSSAATSIFSSTENVNQQHKRGSSVGHKGFAAARKTSTDVLSKSSPSLTLEYVPEVVSTATPPPTFSLTEADIETTKKSPTSTSYFPAMDPFVPGYLSDPESAGTDGSRHRKSSSYSSYQSSERSLLLGSDTTRWSSASTSSIPDLLHSKRKSRSSVPKHRTSRPLESVPHSPSLDAEAHDEDNLAVPARNPLWDKSQHDSLMMRRPDTPGDRQVLYSAGRTVQRGRSATPSRTAIRPITDSDEAGWI